MEKSQDSIETEEGQGAGHEAEGIGLPATAGATLRAGREGLGLSLDALSAHTRIPVRHLQTIEAGHFDELPSRAYALGFARTYARAVGVDENGVVDLVREEMELAGPRNSAMGQGMEPGDPAKLPSNGLAWFGGGAALILTLGVISFASTYYQAGVGPESLLVQQEAEREAEALAAASAAAQKPFDAQTAPPPEGQVIFTALEDGVWVRFYEEGGERLFEAQMASGDTFELPREATEPRINTGRPDAFAITVGGLEVPKLADEPVTMGGTPISAAALLARDAAAPTS
ncbi:MAG: DUF4115 domain-containing protein [Erythrobacter sp.]|uniref:helix-turn-helix domain-containing protein n=1 Tax=Erythrobacter sp. TaxID=1042 RepID=UPI0026278FFF|nr:RodZ domain-containing protein [Erythrobacter sp.]MDJ0978946.1 DUF4115 domain-containing protein [Erythrobacter sp.]